MFQFLIDWLLKFQKMQEITIILSAGHGSLDPLTGEYHCLKKGKKYQYKNGKEYHGNGWVYEGVLNRKYTETIKRHALNAGFKVKVVSHDYLDYPLSQRWKEGDKVKGKAVYLPIHFNASEEHNARGYEHYTTRGLNNSDELGEVIYGKMVTLTKVFPTFKIRTDNSDGDHDKEADFTEIKRTKHLAVYIEVLFFDYEIELIEDPDFEDIFCKYLVDGISLYFRKN